MCTFFKWIPLIIYTVFLISFPHCTTVHTTQGGTGSETVIGRIITDNGNPVPATEITLYPEDFDPVSDTIQSRFFKDTTDSDGRYSIQLKKSTFKKINLQAVHLQQRTRALIADIDISETNDSTYVTDALLHPTSTLKVVLTDSIPDATGYVFIPGSMYHSDLKQGFAIIDSVPSAVIPKIVYKEHLTDSFPLFIAEDIQIEPDIVNVVTFKGVVHAAAICINTTPNGADVTSDVYGFPLLIKLSRDNFDFTEARIDGSDLRFTDSSNHPLPFEIEQWNAEQQKAVVWVKIDTIYGNDSSHSVVMHWGEPSTTIPINSLKVFDTSNGFRGVWHLSEESAGTGTTGLFKDATGRNNGDDFISSTDQAGIIGSGHTFDGIDDYIPVNSPVTDFFKGEGTISLWVNIRDSGGTILSKLDTSPVWYKGEACYYFGDGTDTNTYPGVNGTRPSFVGYHDDYAISGISVAPGSWHYLVYTWKWNGDSTGTKQYFIDGVKVPLSRDSLLARLEENVNSTVRIGQPNNNESIYYFNGSMDELRISAIARNENWIKLSYQNQYTNKVIRVLKIN
jgi:hypothetical protein